MGLTRVSSYFILALPVLICLLIGYRLSESHFEKENAVTPEKGAVRLRSPSTRKNSLKTVQGRNVIRQENEDSGSERWLRWASRLHRAEAEELPDLIDQPPRGSPEYELLLQYWVQKDPSGLMEYWREQYDLSGTDRAYKLGTEFWPLWFTADPEAAAAAVDGLVAASGDRYLKTSYILEALCEHYPKKAIRLDRNILQHRTDYIGYTWPKVIGKRPGEWAAFLAEHGQGFLKESGLSETGKIWGTTDPRAALRFRDKLHGTVRDKFQQEVFRSWAKTDLSEAQEWFFGIENKRTSDQLLPVFLEGWAARDLSAASSWTLENFQGGRLQRSLKGLITGAAWSGFEAIDELWEMMPTKTEQELIRSTLQLVWQINPEQPVWSRDLTATEREWLAARKAQLAVD